MRTTVSHKRHEQTGSKIEWRVPFSYFAKNFKWLKSNNGTVILFFFVTLSGLIGIPSQMLPAELSTEFCNLCSKKHNVVTNKGTFPVASVTKLAISGKNCPKRSTHFAPTYFQMHPPFYCAKCKFPLLDCVTYPWKYNNEVGEWGVYMYFQFLSITSFKISMNLETIKFSSSAVWKPVQWHWLHYSFACCW